MNYKLYALIIFLLFITAFILRLHNIQSVTPGMYGDEITVAVKELAISSTPELLPFLDDYSHPTPLLYLTAQSMQLLGHSMTAVRLPSVLFGALTVSLFYVLLGFFLPRGIAAGGAVLLLFQYSHIVISRLAYEAAASLFLQVFSLLVFYLFYKTRHIVLLILVALILGAGFYTYLNFYLFAAVCIPFTLLIIAKNELLKHLRELLVFCTVLLITLVPLGMSVVSNPQSFFARSAEISIFSRGYSPTEFSHELWANTYRTILLPFISITGNYPPFIGDPNPGKNPAGVTIFDPLTSVLALLGFCFLRMKKRQLFGITMLFFLPPLMSDIFSTEIIPQFHYFGLGHPNLLRISGIIIFILFASAIGLKTLFEYGLSKRYPFAQITLIALVICICVLNVFWYFNQASLNRKFYLYNYKVNHTDILQMIYYFNISQTTHISITNTLAANNGYLEFFLDKSKSITQFSPTSPKQTLSVITKSDQTAIEVDSGTIKVINELLNTADYEKLGYSLHEIKGIINQPDIIIFEKNAKQ